jgi:hypothetical protein
MRNGLNNRDIKYQFTGFSLKVPSLLVKEIYFLADSSEEEKSD